MARRPRPPHFIKEWREFRGISQETLADEIGMTAASISRVESNKQPYSQRLLEAIGQVLHASPADLLGHDPRQADPLRQLLSDATDEQIRQIAAVAEALLKFEAKPPQD